MQSEWITKQYPETVQFKPNSYRDALIIDSMRLMYERGISIDQIIVVTAHSLTDPNSLVYSMMSSLADSKKK